MLEALSRLTFQELSLEIASLWLEEEMNRNDLQKIVDSAFPFDAPLVPVESNVYALELFHGPTFAFKDFGARFMAQILEQFIADSLKELTILVATSGDTGSAVASAFHNLPGIKVVLLFPSGKISEIQRKQMTTLGGNVQAVAIEGNFDDCQRLVKQAFADSELRTRSSINFSELDQYCTAFTAKLLLFSRCCSTFRSTSSNIFGTIRKLRKSDGRCYC